MKIILKGKSVINLQQVKKPYTWDKFEQVKMEGQQVRAKVTWRTKRDTMLAETFNVVKDISQFTRFTPSQT